MASDEIVFKLKIHISEHTDKLMIESEVVGGRFLCGFWWFMLICDLLIPIVMVIVGRMMWKHCPKHINGMSGYRTTRSMKNMDTWKFAHDYCGKLWWKIGWLMMIPSVLIHIPLYHSDKNTIGIAGGILVTIQCILMIVSIYPTEKALKKHFNEDGTRI